MAVDCTFKKTVLSLALELNLSLSKVINHINGNILSLYHDINTFAHVTFVEVYFCY